jgi:hypothetical protein
VFYLLLLPLGRSAATLTTLAGRFGFAPSGRCQVPAISRARATPKRDRCTRVVKAITQVFSITMYVVVSSDQRSANSSTHICVALLLIEPRRAPLMAKSSGFVEVVRRPPIPDSENLRFLLRRAAAVAAAACSATNPRIVMSGRSANTQSPCCALKLSADHVGFHVPCACAS